MIVHFAQDNHGTGKIYGDRAPPSSIDLASIVTGQSSESDAHYSGPGNRGGRQPRCAPHAMGFPAESNGSWFWLQLCEDRGR